MSTGSWRKFRNEVKNAPGWAFATTGGDATADGAGGAAGTSVGRAEVAALCTAATGAAGRACCRRDGGTAGRRDDGAAACGCRAASWISFQALRHSSKGDGRAGIGGGPPPRRVLPGESEGSESRVVPLFCRVCQLSHSHLTKLPTRNSTTMAICNGSKSPRIRNGVKAGMGQNTFPLLTWRRARLRRFSRASRCRRAHFCIWRSP